jgi:hypothetical protein
MWGFIHVLYLIGWGNRFGTIYMWARGVYFSKNRGHRIITYERANEEIEEGRTASGRPKPILPRSTRAVEAAAPEALPQAAPEAVAEPQPVEPSRPAGETRRGEEVGSKPAAEAGDRGPRRAKRT